MTGKLTTHVLDTAYGKPAAQLYLELWQVTPETGLRSQLLQTRTNDDGRTDGPLLSEDQFRVGVYELIFFVGDYFAQQATLPSPAFLNRVPIQFGIADPEAHYHVPLLVSPWAYSTYRGS